MVATEKRLQFDKFGIWVVPPLVINDDEIRFIVNVIDQSLALADDWVKNW